MRQDITYVKSSAIGWDLALGPELTKYTHICLPSTWNLSVSIINTCISKENNPCYNRMAVYLWVMILFLLLIPFVFSPRRNPSSPLFSPVGLVLFHRLFPSPLTSPSPRSRWSRCWVSFCWVCSACCWLSVCYTWPVRLPAPPCTTNCVPSTAVSSIPARCSPNGQYACHVIIRAPFPRRIVFLFILFH